MIAVKRTGTVVAVDGFSVPAGVYADHVPDLFRVVAADRKSVVVSCDRRVYWSHSVRAPSSCIQHTDIHNTIQFLLVRRVLSTAVNY